MEPSTVEPDLGNANAGRDLYLSCFAWKELLTMKISTRKIQAIAAVFIIILGAISFNLLNSNEKAATEVTLVTHDSFVMSAGQITQFTESTGLRLRLIKAGDTGSLTNRLILTKDVPIADAVFGIDNTFSGKAISAGIIDGSLTAIDFGEVAFNYDKDWFSAKKVPAPQSLDDLIKPIYKNLTVLQDPNTSSTGLSFLAATVDKFGKAGWENYWQGLRANGVKVTDGWESAYFTEFSGSSGKGKYPIVLSYGSSPAAEVRSNGLSQTGIINDGVFRQTEYAGVIKGAKNPEGAKAVIKFLLGKEFQASLPTAMYVYPIVEGTPLPPDWEKFTQVAVKTYGDTLDIDANRDLWLQAWSSIFDR